MKIIRGLWNLQHALRHEAIAGCALTIGNFDGVHRGHQAMLALLNNEARHRGVPSCVMTFEPHPRDYFAAVHHKPDLAPARIATLRDKLEELARCGVDRCVVLPFNARLASQTPQAFIEDTLVRVSSSAVREALAAGDMDRVAALLGRPFSISGHVVHGRKLGRQLAESSPGRGDGFRTLNLRFAHWKPAASGIFAVHVHGLGPEADSPPLPGVANLGVRPSLDPNDANGGRVLLETHCLEWPEALVASLPGGEAYGKIIRVELLHKLHDELKYDSLDALTRGIARDCDDARAFFASLHTQTHRQTTRDRI